MITTNKETLRNISLDFSGTPEELKNLFSLLEFELKSHPSKNGIGLSGIQINIPIRVAIIRAGKESINLYNAKILKTEQPYVFKGEGCLSVPGIACDTNRFNLIEVQNGDGAILKFSGVLATAVLHETDHWSGVLFTDKQV